MQGCIVLCSCHMQVFNSALRTWVSVSSETMSELNALASELGGVDIHEGCCPACSSAVKNSFEHLYALRYNEAMCRELTSIMDTGDYE